MTFEQFFKAATGHAPYDYQRRLAGGDAGRACESHLINVPTDLRKTAAVVLAWLWNRLAPSLNSQPLAAPQRGFLAIVDVVAALTGSPNSQQVYCRVMKKRLLAEGNQTVTNCNVLILA